MNNIGCWFENDHAKSMEEDHVFVPESLVQVTRNIDQILLLLLPSLHNKSTFYKSGDILFGKIVRNPYFHRDCDGTVGNGNLIEPGGEH